MPKVYEQLIKSPITKSDPIINTSDFFQDCQELKLYKKSGIYDEYYIQHKKILDLDIINSKSVE